MTMSRGQDSKLMIIEKLMCIEAILIVILAWLPPKSIFRFKCVSKTWNRLLVEPFFFETYYKASRAKNVVVGYNGERLIAFISTNIAHYMAPLDVRCGDPTDTITLTKKRCDVSQLVPKRFNTICHSYNGLILCESRPSIIGRTFYIVNPVTRMFVILPPWPEIYASSPGLTWEENTHSLVPIYKVVLAHPIMHTKEKKNKLVIDTYCSRRCKWEQSTLIARENFSGGSFYTLLVSNGVFHWNNGRNEALVVYDSNRDEKHVQLIKRPTCKSNSSITKASRDGVLWFGRNHERQDWREPMIYFWILPKDKLCESYKHATTIEADEWILMYSICARSFCNDLNTQFCVNIKPHYLNFLALLPCNPVLAVLGSDKNIFLYNLESKCVELVTHRASSDIHLDRCCRLIPYVESLSLSSYALSTTYY